MEVRGRDLIAGLPRTIPITSSEVMEAIELPLQQLVAAVRQVLEQTPLELRCLGVRHGGGRGDGVDPAAERGVGERQDLGCVDDLDGSGRPGDRPAHLLAGHRVDNDHAGERVGEVVVVVLAPLQQRVDRHRNGADPDRAPEGGHHRRRVVQGKQDPLLSPDAELLEAPSRRAGKTVQAAVGDRAARPVDGDLIAPARLQVAVEERARVIRLGHQDAMRRLAKSVCEMPFTNAFGSTSGRSTAVSKTNA